jgi:hypothetical protein
MPTTPAHETTPWNWGTANVRFVAASWLTTWLNGKHSIKKSMTLPCVKLGGLKFSYLDGANVNENFCFFTVIGVLEALMAMPVKEFCDVSMLVWLDVAGGPACEATME